MNPADLHVLRNILIQMLVNTRTPDPGDVLSGAQVKKLKTLYGDLGTVLSGSKRRVRQVTGIHRYK
ncbi:MAG TPA: hypothetical protein VGH22_00335 [Candidatus Binatia bacterium]|jgi:hypothetical protein